MSDKCNRVKSMFHHLNRLSRSTLSTLYLRALSDAQWNFVSDKHKSWNPINNLYFSFETEELFLEQKQFIFLNVHTSKQKKEKALQMWNI